MSPLQLCPSKLNDLGKGVFSPQRETDLLAGGYIFACKIPGARVATIIVCKRPIADAVTDGELDSVRYRTPNCM